MIELSKSEFAAHKGWSKPYVSKLAKQGRLVMTADGKVDVAATEALLQRTADPSKTGVADRHQRERIERGVTAHLTPAAPPLDPQPDRPEDEDIDLQKARARREHYLARLAENEARKSDGELVEREAVENAAFATGRLLRDLLLGLPKQIGAELAAISDPWELERRLTAGLRRVLEDAQRLSAADLEAVLKPPS
ncbi:terminase small subunit [Azotobacter chroococcum]|uniref:Terminase small subunit n=1 Tax=Azotobacter chroococcum TaxID=353 RepID=A0AA43ZCH2_9GAMM|nr:terminase small subunit [Azotobacter chroococcum]NHN79697.1 terminase small subunit [Azotobacter chroococcum]